jgi:hypothetical protein
MISWKICAKMKGSIPKRTIRSSSSDSQYIILHMFAISASWEIMRSARIKLGPDDFNNKTRNILGANQRSNTSSAAGRMK